MYYKSHFETAIKLISQYEGSVPLNIFLKQYFSANKKHGSSDRKIISKLCYAYFRLGMAMKGSSVEEKIITGLFLTSDSADKLLEFVKPEWFPQASSSLDEKIRLVSDTFILTDIFPWGDLLSDDLNHEQFCRSMLVQPDLFLRIRPGHEQTVPEKLTAHDRGYEFIPPFSLRMENGSAVEKVLDINREVVVQDLNSQQTGIFIQSACGSDDDKKYDLWDCCAASGGKSILLHDLLQLHSLTVSDIRESVLQNLEKRFHEAGIRKFKMFTEDLSGEKKTVSNKICNLLVTDAPCSGSGTWSRTPEAISFFHPGSLQKFQTLQKQILLNVLPALEKSGHLFYITCSVFRAENEEVINAIAGSGLVEFKSKKIFPGYRDKADSMFIAHFTT